MRRRDLVVNGWLAVVAGSARGAELQGARPTLQVQQILDSHERLRRRLGPGDRAILDRLSGRLLKALPRNAHLPDDARNVLLRAAPGLTSAEVGTLADYSSAQLFQATQQMQETQMSFNLQYLQLQSETQNENRQFTMVSNIMKPKHDTVKNSISNIR